MIKSYDLKDKLSFNKLFFLFFAFSLVSGPLIPEILILLLIINFICQNKTSLLISKNLRTIFIFLISFYLYLNLNTLLFSFDFKISLKSTLPYLRLILFCFIISVILKSEDSKRIINYFIFSFLLLLLILLFDSIVQLNTGQNILGHRYFSGRITSLFNEEQILGSFVVKILPIILSFLYIIELKNKKYLKILFIFLTFILILLSSERIALVQYIFIVFLIIFIDTKNLKTFFSSLIIFLSLIIIALNLYAPGMKRIKDATLEQFNSSTTFLAPSYRHELHYHNAILMFLDKPIFGNGIKSFRYICSNYDNLVQDKINTDKAIYAPYDGIATQVENYNDENFDVIKFQKKPKSKNSIDEYTIFHYNNLYKKFNSKINSKNLIKKDEFLLASFEYPSGCNTHPHNYFLQFLSELGSIGFVFYVISFLFILIKFFKIILKKCLRNKINNLQKSVYIISGSILIELMPLIPSGNFFNNWLSMIFYFKLGLLLFFLEKSYNKKDYV